MNHFLQSERRHREPHPQVLEAVGSHRERRLAHQRDEPPRVQRGARRGGVPRVLLSKRAGAEVRNHRDGQPKVRAVLERRGVLQSE